MGLRNEGDESDILLFSAFIIGVLSFGGCCMWLGVVHVGVVMWEALSYV